MDSQPDTNATTSSVDESSSQEYKEPIWTTNDKLKLTALKKIHQTSAPKEKFSSDWKQVGQQMGRRPGDCFRQYCSFGQNAWTWTLDEDVNLIKLLDAGETDAGQIAREIYPRSRNQHNRVAARIELLKRNQLDTMALYEGLSANNEKDAPTDDLTQALDNLNLSDNGHTAFKKAKEDALNELARQKERVNNINREWAIKCANDMVCRDYGIYDTYYKNDEQRKEAIKHGEPTQETVLPKVIDGYARSNGKCCYCDRAITFSELKSDHPPTAASPDHFEPRMMAFNSDTFLHFTCRQCNYAKSNATHAVYKRYLGQIRAFHYQDDKLFDDYIPVDEENRQQAWLTWKQFKKTQWKKRTDGIIQDLEIVGSLIPKDDHDRLFMEMVDAMGLRDPMTGARGVYDSTYKESTRFIITNWDWSWGDNRVITGFDVAPFESLGVQIILKFTKDTQAEFGVLHFDDWLKAIQTTQ